jgi:hypothetical protein
MKRKIAILVGLGVLIWVGTVLVTMLDVSSKIDRMEQTRDALVVLQKAQEEMEAVLDEDRLDEARARRALEQADAAIEIGERTLSEMDREEPYLGEAVAYVEGLRDRLAAKLDEPALADTPVETAHP